MGSCNSIGIRFSYTRWINSIEICWAFFLAYTLTCVSLTELYVHVFWPFLCQALVFLTLRVIYKLRRLSLCLCGRYFLTVCNLSFFLSDVIFFIQNILTEISVVGLIISFFLFLSILVPLTGPQDRSVFIMQTVHYALIWQKLTPLIALFKRFS